MIGDRIREARGALSQTDFGAQLGVSQATISQWEKGGREPGIDDLIKISEKFGIDFVYLATGKHHECAGKREDKIVKIYSNLSETEKVVFWETLLDLSHSVTE